MAVEVCFLIGPGESVLWSDRSDSAVALPDSRLRWQALWSRRDELVEVAHSHPTGPLAFSVEDDTTMEAVTAALGRAVVFSVVAPAGMVRHVGGADRVVDEEPWWASLLRAASGMDG